MIFPSLEIRTRQDTGKLHGDLVFGDRTFHGIAGSLVDFVTTMATNPHLPKEIQEWIGDTFWTENEKLKAQAGSLVDERDRLEVENEKLKARFVDIVDRSEGLRATVAEAQGKNSNLERLLHDADGKYLDARQDVLRLESEIRDLKAQLSKLQTDNEHLVGQAAVQIRENEKLEGQIQQKDGEIVTLRAQIEKAQDLDVEIHNSETVFRQQSKALQDELAKQRQQNVASGYCIYTLEQDNKGLTDQIHNHQKEIQELKDRIANLQDEEIDSDTLIRDLEIKISEANKQILSLETDNAALRTKLERGEITPLEEAHRTIDLLLDRLTYKMVGTL